MYRMKFCIVDVSNLVHRAKHSISAVQKNTPHDPFGDEDDVSSDIVRVGLILSVVLNGFMNAYEKFGADHCVAAFDKRSWRRDVYPEYKATRRNALRTPEEIEEKELIVAIIDELRDFLYQYTNVTVLEAEGLEADDLIARWVQLHDDPLFQHVIVSSDGDFKQLVRHGVDLFNPMGANSRTLYTIDGVFVQDGKKARKVDIVETRYGAKWKRKLDKKTGVPVMFDPAWELFEKCIRGDSSDNISSAYPRVRTTKMRKAYEGGVEEYNNFINSTWGEGEHEKSVRDLYERNRMLIDLTCQPDNIIQLMDETIEVAISRKPARLIGAYFSKFCGKYGLHKISPRATSFVSMLASEYPK